MKIGNASGYSTKMQNARSQLAFYMKRGYIKRVRRGVYSISPKGQEVFNKEAPSDGAEGASRETGGVATPSDME